MSRRKLWIAVGALLLLVALWLMAREPEVELAGDAAETDTFSPEAEFSADPPPTAAAQPDALQPSAATPTAPSPSPAQNQAPAQSQVHEPEAPAAPQPEFPRKRAIERLRLRFLTRGGPAPGISASREACDQLLAQREGAETLSPNEQLKLRLLCKGR